MISYYSSILYCIYKNDCFEYYTLVFIQAIFKMMLFFTLYHLFDVNSIQAVHKPYNILWIKQVKFLL